GAMILPELAVITAVRTAHTEGLGSVDAVGVEKRNLLLTLGAGDSAVLPADDLQLSDAHFLAEGVIADAPFERIRFGEGGSVFVKTHDFALVDGRPVRRMVLSAPGGDLMLDLRSVGFGAMRGAAAAVAVLNAEPIRALREADAIDTSALRDAFEQIESTPGRMQLRGRKHLVIDDSYNASPASMEAAIDDAAALAALVRRPLVLMLGPMGELGELSAEAHANVLKLAVASGGRSVLVADEYVVLPTHEETGRVQKQSVEEAIAFELAEPSVVLVKASRSARLERVADALSGGVA
ncbi:MAG: cyanophycin synthetase, partial [Myxococcota bacterium]